MSESATAIRERLRAARRAATESGLEPVASAAARVGLSESRLKRLCRDARVPGAELRAGFPPQWWVPLEFERSAVLPNRRRVRRY